MTQVKCHVNTCTHWLSGQCGAGNIDILNETEIMPRSSEDTECKTFHRKEGITSYISSMDNVNWSGIASTLTGVDMNPTITCVVDTCHYWGQNDECHADAIEESGSDAEHSQDTNCGTFKPKGVEE